MECIPRPTDTGWMFLKMLTTGNEVNAEVPVLPCNCRSIGT